MTNTYTWSLQGNPMVSKSLDGMTNVIRSVGWYYRATDPDKAAHLTG